MEALVQQDTTAPMLSSDQLVTIAEQAEKRIEAIKKIKTVALKVTNANDWVDQNGRPYLQASGAEKVARLFGISWRISEPGFQEFEDGHFQYTYKGEFSLGDTTIEAIGSRSSRDGFFSIRYRKDQNGKSEKFDLPPGEIDKGDVKKAAYTNLLGNGITRLLGIRNLSYDDLKEVGITREMITRFKYDSKKDQKEEKEMTSTQKKKIWSMMKEKGLSNGDSKEFFSFVQGDKKTTMSWASDFITNFESYYKSWIDSNESKKPETVDCPDKGIKVEADFCNSQCPKRQGCPAFE